ncbi:hypothetical protein DCC85_20895 [Paenibacillus sp. CAA11]|uniref:histidine kinase N-terminal 7TM domain-containing diguanylate cyclase n=1 Tax=Paenibacillus sp. CAA11 TaxID=1532905 RepID=UPI000D340A8A|nr:diguanylate cyclase [Paenibacillus sp. CAA11]AWB46378.1 hypothetical protein DCC85_20895 [Paenibacillus sp. CAA11]
MLLSFAFLLAGLLIFWGALFARKHRNVVGANYLFILCLLAELIIFTSNMEIVSTRLADKLLWRNLQQPGYFYTPVLIYLLARSYAMQSSSLSKRKIAALLAVPTAALILIYSGYYMRSQVGLDDSGTLVVKSTPLETLFLLYGLLLSILGIVFLLKSAISTRGTQRRQLLTLAIGIALPLIISWLRGMELFPIKGYGASIAVTYIPSCFCIFWGVFKYQLFRIVPLARDKLFDVMREGIVVLDARGVIVDVNSAAVRMLQCMGAASKPANGMVLSSLLPKQWQDSWMGAHGKQAETEFEISFQNRNTEGHYSVRVLPIIYGKGVFAGSMSVLTDVTEVKQIEQQLRIRAVTDGLTGIYNRTGFIEQSEGYFWLPYQEDQPLVLLLMDIDYFKKINDQYGHMSGDDTIRAFSSMVLDLIGPNAVFGRVGGEEFALTLPYTSLEEAWELAEVIRAAAERLQVQGHGGHIIRFTVSVGAAIRSEENSSYERLYFLADEALYEAKQDGRNRVCVSSCADKSILA